MPGLTLEIAIALGAMAHRRGINSSLFSEKSVPSSRSEAELPAYLDDKETMTATAEFNFAAPSRRIDLMGMPIDVVTQGEAVEMILAGWRAGRGGWVITPNLDQLRLFHQKPELRGMYQQASLVLADGMPLVWASRLQGSPLPERVAGSEIIFSLTAAAAAAGASIYFLGGNPGAAEAASVMLAQKYPGLKVAGFHCPEFGFEKNADALAAIEADLRRTRPDIVYVGLGFPKQERLIERLRPALPTAWYLGIGVSFSFVSGEVKRAPVILRKLGMEWAHRMSQEPGRLVKRYLVHGLPFAGRLLSGSLVRRYRK